MEVSSRYANMGGLEKTSPSHSSHGGLSTAGEMENFLKRTLKPELNIYLFRALPGREFVI